VANPAQLSVALLPVALMGAAVGFLPFNFNPARIFMGSSGSYFIGFALAALGIIGGARLATVMLVVGLPALDVAWLIYDRNRRGISPGQGGRDHLHFRLLDRGLSERAIVVGYWAYCALLGGMTLVIDSRFYKVVALIATGVVGLGVLVWASRYSPSDSTGIVNKGVATDDVTKLPPSGK
jgi:UDP-GlcNAc:undecaprenyl-phosphate GlcNAc-1-phosphate transferase